MCLSSAIVIAALALSPVQDAPLKHDALSDAEFGMMLVPSVTSAELKRAADVIAVPVARLSDVEQCSAAHERRIAALQQLASTISQDHGIASAIMNPRADLTDEAATAEAFDRGIMLINRRVLPAAREARKELFDCIKNLCEAPSPARVRVLHAMVNHFELSRAGPPQPDLLALLAAGKRRGREYGQLVPDDVADGWELALVVADRAEAIRSKQGEIPPASLPPFEQAIDGYLNWLTEPIGALSVQRLDSWADSMGKIRAGENLVADQWKRFATFRDGVIRHTDAIERAIAEQLHGELADHALRDWRQDVRAARFPMMFEGSELELAAAMLKRAGLDESTGEVIAAKLDAARAALEQKDTNVLAALVASHANGTFGPPGFPGTASVDAACRDRVATLDAALDDLGAALAGSDFEPRWRSWILETRRTRDGFRIVR